MYAVERLGSYISRGVYTVSGPFHPFGGAVDIIVVEQPDGSYKSSPWYVRFGKFQGVLKAREKEVTIEVNGVERDFHMVLDQRGEAYFYRELEGGEGEGEGESLGFSSSSGDEMDEQSQKNGRPMKSLSGEYEGTNGSGDLINTSNGKNLARTNSRQSRISGIIFGRRLVEEVVYHKSGSGTDAVNISSVERAEMTADLFENLMLDDNNLEEKFVEISETSRNTDEFNLQDADQVCDAEDLVSEVSDSQMETVNKQAEDAELDMESHDTYAQRTIPSTPSSHSHDEVSFEVPATVSPFTQMVYVDPVPVFDSGEIETNNITSTAFTNSVDQIQDDISIGNEITRNRRQFSLESVGVSEQLNGDDDQTEATNILVSESSQEEQFFFSDVDDSEPREAQVELGFPDAAGEDSHPPSCPERITIMNDTVCTNDESYSSPCSLQKLTETSNLTSSPISIMKHHNTGGPEVARQAESLPNLWSNMEKEDSPCSLSHSLDLNSKSFEWKMRHGNESNSSNSENGDDNLLVHGYSKDENNLCLEDIKDGLRNPAVEISLCKHLLYEGMGAEAASQAFDAQKLDIRKFTSIGPEVVKNDRLVVRIRGHYFPWDAACPVVLGMVAFGSENIFELKGMIPVDRVEKSLVVDQSETTVTTGGGWRLWPFGFRRSRSRKGTQPTLNNNRSFDTENGSESNAVMDTDSNALDGVVSKKIVKAVTPTSGELKSLNLKEGSNEVIFTFSTAMLGRQKVDARIYLWKWNTRIVISDVDGTITKSDVLGQFMPLVGIDWSQTGVTHLFSAIKDNGYQFLYLSARAISQAYITRQFLVNLKQDGKALPDGPVVISPDGLFPSLFREVIRRAPHEFKIACLEEIKALFPSDCNPFYAGFGNRDTDEISYLKVGIPKGKIFIINPKGEVAVNRLVDTRSYTSLHALVHGMFPAMTSSEQEDYNSWNFWKLPPPDIDM